MRPKVLVLTYFYEPEPNFITADVAEALAQDASVTVVTTHPNYPTGRFYPGTRYWRPTRSEEKGVTVWRLPIFPDQSTSLVRRALSYLSWAMAATLFAPWVAGRPDRVWVYQTPFTTALAAPFFKVVHRSRIIYTAADLWPESFSAVGLVEEGWLYRLAYAYSRAINRLADHVICTTRGTMDRYRSDGMAPERLSFVPVWSQGVTLAEEPERTRKSVVYAGNLGEGQHLEPLIEAAAILKDEGSDVVVDLFGTGTREAYLRQLAEERGASNVRFHGRVPPEEAFHASSSAFCQVVTLRDSPMFERTIPTKLLTSFAAGAPIVYSLPGEAGALAAESGGAVPFSPEDPRSFVAVIRSLERRPPEWFRQTRAELQAYFRDRFAREGLLEDYRTRILPEDAAPADRASAAEVAG